MSKLLLVIVLTLVIVLFIINSLFSVKSCPSVIDSSFLACNSSSDCYFNLKYGCMNHQPLNCIVSGDLSARESVASMISCDCVNNSCVEVVN